MEGISGRVVAFVALILVLGGAVFYSINRGYGEISPKGYEYAKAMYSICNRKDSGRLEDLSEMIEDSVASGEISSTEAEWLTSISDSAAEGDWESATAESRRLLDDQVSGR